MKIKYFYGYNIVAAGFYIQAVTYGMMFSYGLFFKEFQAEFGWSRTIISGASSLCFVLGGATGIIAGRVSDLTGPKLVTMVASIPFGFGYLLLSFMNAPWHLYVLYGVMVGIGFGTNDLITLSTAARWFLKRRGMMSGIIKVGTGFGQVVIPLVAAQLIKSYGWRNAYLILGAVFLVTLGTVAQILKRDPQEKGLLPDNAEHEAGLPLGGYEELGIPLKPALTTKQFWAICLAEFSSFFCILTIIVHLVPHATDLGLPRITAAGILSTIGAASIAGRIVLGTANDRVGGKSSLCLCFIILIFTLLWLQVAVRAWMLFLFAVIYGFAHGGFFTVVSPTVAEYFGTSSHGVLFGIVLFCGNAGAAIGPLVGGRIFDMTQSYRLVFIILTLVAAVGLFFVSSLRPLHYDKRSDE